VYLAHDIRHYRKVGLKVLKPEIAAVIGAARFLGDQDNHISPEPLTSRRWRALSSELYTVEISHRDAMKRYSYLTVRIRGAKVFPGPLPSVVVRTLATQRYKQFCEEHYKVRLRHVCNSAEIDRLRATTFKEFPMKARCLGPIFRFQRTVISRALRPLAKRSSKLVAVY
jgi:hypothetical protein